MLISLGECVKTAYCRQRSGIPRSGKERLSCAVVLIIYHTENIGLIQSLVLQSNDASVSIDDVRLARSIVIGVGYGGVGEDLHITGV